MADDFIENLKADWDRQSAEAAVVRLRRRRWTPYLLLAGDLAAALMMLGFGAIYAALAVRYRDLLFGLSAVAMAPVGFPLILAGVWLRWRGLAWEGETAEGVLRSSVRRLDATRRVLRLGRGAAFVMFALVVLVWGCMFAGLVREPRSFLFLVTASWIAAGIGAVYWVHWRLGRVGREIARCEELLGQFELSADQAPA